jgi:hypothetical protein
MMKRWPILAIVVVALSFAATSSRTYAQATAPGATRAAVPAPPPGTDDVDIHFSDGRQYSGDALVHTPKKIVVDPADKSTTTFVNGKPPSGSYVVVPDGPGKITYANGSTLQAIFANGVANGEGDYESSAGFSFKGTFSNGVPVSGVATYPDGASYNGTFVDGLPDGQGIWTSTGRVQRAEGTWSKGALVNGTVTFRDGARYVGGLDADGKTSGPGRFELPDGSVLSGTFADGNYTGRFTERFTPGSETTGPPRRLLIVDVSPSGPAFDGRARLTFANGNALIGSVRDGAFDGPGAFVYRDGAAFRGTLVDGRFQGPVVWTNGRGVTIASTIRRGRMEGTAVLTTPRGKTIRGLISEDGNFYTFTGPVDDAVRPNGSGIYGYIDGETVRGRWSHGKLIGPVVDKLPDGTTYFVTVPSPSDVVAGPARIVLPNGNVATGRLERSGYLQGLGTLTIAGSNDVLHGNWVDGTLHHVR